MADLIGESIPFENDRSGELRIDATTTRVFRFTGPVETLKIRAPAKGSVYSVDGVNCTVLSSVITPDSGGMGELAITVVPLQSTIAGIEPTSEHLEITYVETSQPLAFHPNFPAGQDGELLDEWRRFLASPESVQLSNKYCPDPSDEKTFVALDNALLPWAALYNKGIKDFVEYLPVVSRIRTYEADPAREIAGVGRRENPPLIPAGFTSGEWLKTADNSVGDTASGRWTRTEAWTWAAEWPHLLYS